MKADKEVRLSWTGSGLVFDGGPTDRRPQLVVDGDSATGPSPMDLVLTAVAACMAIDIKVILEKGRVPFDSLDVTARGERRDEPPRHYRAAQLVFSVTGVAAREPLQGGTRGRTFPRKVLLGPLLPETGPGP